MFSKTLPLPGILKEVLLHIHGIPEAMRSTSSNISQEMLQSPPGIPKTMPENPYCHIVIVKELPTTTPLKKYYVA